jgi:hypothetical protein
MERLLADTGYLVALGRQADPYHKRALRFASRFDGELFTSSAIVVEACHFLSAGSQVDLLNMAQSDRLRVAEVPVTSYGDLAVTIEKYADADVDFADASLLWLADRTGLRRILTVDVRDFSVLRTKNGKRFELVDWP